jgi:hypothetical protein
MKGFKKRYLLSVAAATFVAGWVDPTPPIDPHPVGPAEGVDRDANISLRSVPTPRARSMTWLQKSSLGDRLDNDGLDGRGSETTLNRWLGLNERQLQTVLGPAIEQEDRAPAKLRSFRNRNCTLNVTLNPDVETREFHALDYKVISDAHTAKRNRECVAEFSARLSQR